MSSSLNQDSNAKTKTNDLTVDNQNHLASTSNRSSDSESREPRATTADLIPESFQHSTHDSHLKGRSIANLHHSPLSISSPSSPVTATAMRAPREPEAAGHGAGLRGRDEEQVAWPSSSSSSSSNSSSALNPGQSTHDFKSNSILSLSKLPSSSTSIPSSTTHTATEEATDAQQQQINNLHLLAALAPQSGQADLAPTSPLTPIAPPESRKLCIRHQRMADEGKTARLQKSIESLPLSDQTAVNTVWSLFSSSSHSRRALILQGLLTMCCFSQLSLLSSELALAIRIDPFSLFPREVCIRVLTHLDAITLGRAAQVSKTWKSLADDDVLWRNMCEQHIERKCEKCGWGLPLLSERRRRVKGLGSKKGTLESRQLTIETVKALKAHDSTSHSLPQSQPKSAPLQNFPGMDGAGEASQSNPTTSTSSASSTGSGNLKRSITAAANAAALERQSKTASSSRAGSPSRQREEDDEEVDVNQPPSKKACSSSIKSQPSSSSSSDQQQVIKASASAAQPVPQTITRPWKTVYCERLAIERNWRSGRHAVKTLSGHKEGIMCLQYSDSLAHPSFPVVITGSYDRTARVWNLETGEELRVLRGHTRGVRCLRFDEAKLITGSMDRTLKIWNWRTGELIRTLEGHTEGIVCLDFNQDTLASGSADAEIKVWNFRTGKCVTLRGHEDWVNAVQLWTGPGSKEKLKEKEKAYIHNGSTDWASSDLNSIEPDETAAGSFLFSASDDGTIRLWDLGLRECLLVYDGHVGQVQSIKLLMLDEEAVRKLANGAAGGPGADQADRKRYGYKENPHSLSAEYAPRSGQGSSYFSYPDGSHSTPEVSCGLNPSSVQGGRSANTSAPGIPEHFYDASNSSTSGSSSFFNKQEMEREQHRRRKIDPVLARVQERLHEAGLVDAIPIDAEMRDIEGGIFPHHSKNSSNSNGQDGSETSRTSPNANSTNKTASSHHPMKRPVLLSGSLDNTLKVWDVRTGRCLRTLFGHVEGVWALDVDKLRIASASHDRTIKIWDRETALCQNTLVGHKGAVTCVALGDDKIVSGSDDGDVRCWSFAPPE